MFLTITVDLETSYSTEIKTGRTDLVDVMIFGLYDGERYGFQKIIEICDKNAVKATFFVSSLDSCKFGEDVFQSICKEIVAEGHDAQVHTHPVRLFNDGREHMWQYSLDEQKMILKTASEQIKKWTGENPVAHRAGAYGINEETFVALQENEIPIDSSSFYGHPNCKAVITKNKIVEYDGIIEVPVTIFKRNRQVSLRNWVLGCQSSFVKTDIDFASLDELKSFVQQAKKHDIRMMNLFLHSYSFLKFDSNFTKFQPNWTNMEKFDIFLNFVADAPEINCITMKEFYQLYRENSEQFCGSDYVPVADLNEKFNLFRHGMRKVRNIIHKITVAGELFSTLIIGII